MAQLDDNHSSHRHFGDKVSAPAFLVLAIWVFLQRVLVQSAGSLRNHALALMPGFPVFIQERTFQSPPDLSGCSIPAEQTGDIRLHPGPLKDFPIADTIYYVAMASC